MDSATTRQASICPSCEKQVDSGIKFCPTCGTPIVHAPSNDDWIGRIVAGKYRVEEMIGEGGMGQVFRATQLSLDKSVVLKVLRRSLLSDARTVARFQREAKAASRLNHPNAIGIIDFGQDSDDSLYIAMEYVSGRDLHQILSEEGPLPEKRLIRIVAQVLAALADAHAVGVIHRDLKPENIMVEQRRDQPDFVKVLDFGIAKLQENSGSEGQALTRAGFVCGTPEYMSPEQASGAEIDPRSDLYAVGVILYQCLTGVLPFDADSPVALATMHLTEEPVPPREKKPDIHCSDGLERIILRALSKDPEDRPQTAEQFRAALISIEKSQRAAAKREASARRHVKPAASQPARAASEPAERTLPLPSTVFSSLAATKTPSDAVSEVAGAAGAATALRRSETARALLISWIPEAWSFEKRPLLYVGAALALLIALVIGGLKLASDADSIDPRLAVEQGDKSFLAKQYAQALHYYQLAYQVDPSPRHMKRRAMALLALGDADELDKALRQYRLEGADERELEFIDHYLEAQKKAPKAKALPMP